MSNHDCCQGRDDCDVKVTVEVSKIVKYVSIAGVLIVGIIFGTRTFRKMLEVGFFETMK